MASYILSLGIGGNELANAQWVGGPPAVVLSVIQGWWGGDGHGSLSMAPPAFDATAKSWKFELTISGPEPILGQPLWFLGQLRLNDGKTVIGVPVTWEV